MSNRVRWAETFVSEMKVPFVSDFTRRLERLYESTYLETEHLPPAYQRYLRAHLLRTLAELALLNSAEKYSVQAAVSLNSSHDAHALVIDGPYVLTVSRAESPTKPPRQARFRSTYAEYCALGQFPLPGPDFSGTYEVVAVSDEAHPRYVLITHGPKTKHGREVGFIHANMVVPGANGFRFLGSGVDLLSKFGSLSTPSVEEVPEPQVRLKENDAEEQDSGFGI